MVKAGNPDVIVVLPHMGKQFTHGFNDYQEAWFKVFLEAGADVICGNHSHAVQPIEFRENALVMGCCGNFTNSYTRHDGDASSLLEIYFDRNDKTILGVGVIPLYAQAPLGRTYRALPVYDIVSNPQLREQISVYEFSRVKTVHEIVTQVMLGHKLSVDMITPRYYKTRDGFVQDQIPPCTPQKGFKHAKIVKLMSAVNAVCFVGDSITEGSRNGGTGWYEPMMAHFPNVTHCKKAWDGGTIPTLLAHIDEIAEIAADLYVVAIGTNDVRYRNESKCAMTTDAYVKEPLIK